MKTEAEGIRETFLKGAYEQELKDQVQGILRKEGVFSAKTEVDMEKELQLTNNTLWNSHRKTEGGG